MLRRVKQYIKQNNLIHEGDKILVAISGGADSVALLDVLSRCGYPIIAAHCNFHLRGDESNRDEQFVRDLCAKRDIILYINNFATETYAKDNNLSIEMAARDLRYQWFEQIRKETNCTLIAVAHHQNDQAETLLLNLKRGTGIRGLQGMLPKNGYIIRPLLCTTRDYIEHYCQLRNLDFVVDSTNQDTAYKRNNIRMQLKQYPKADIEHMAQTAQRMQGYTKLIDDYIESLRPSLVKVQNDKTIVNLTNLLKSPAAEVVLYELIKDFGFKTTDEIFAAICSGKGGKKFTSPTHSAVIKSKRLTIESISSPMAFGIIGKPLGHSFSAKYFNQKFAAEGIKAHYALYELDSLMGIRELIQQTHLLGFNVTIPYKESILPYLDEIDPVAAAIGAVNVVKVSYVNGIPFLKGFNTDYIGFTCSLLDSVDKQSVENKNALILGTGGVSKAVAYALKQMNMHIDFASRDPHKGIEYSNINAYLLANYRLIVNCTPLGMSPAVDACPTLPYDAITSAHILFDCIYNPEETVFLSNGRQHNATTINGYPMLIEQANAAWSIWTQDSK